MTTYTVEAHRRWGWQPNTIYSERSTALSALQALDLLGFHLATAALWVRVIDDRNRRVRQGTLIRAAQRAAAGRNPGVLLDPVTHREIASRLIDGSLTELLCERLHRDVTTLWPKSIPDINWIRAGVWWGRTVRRQPGVAIQLDLAARFGDHHGPRLLVHAALRSVNSLRRRRRPPQRCRPVGVPTPRQPLASEAS